MGHVMLREINEGSQNWVVDARVVRFSDFMSGFEPDKRVRIDLVLLDAEGNIMEGQVPEHWHKRSRLKLEEDKIYTIRYFQVVRAKRSYRAADRECMIQFSPHTTIEEPKCIPNNFPLYGHAAVSFDVLRSRIDDDTLTSDTIAMLTACSHARDQHTHKSGIKRLRNLRISDGIETVNVALWGKHADAFDADSFMQNSNQRPIPVLLCGMTCRKFSDKLSLQSSSIFRWYINPDIPEAHSLRQNYAAQAAPLIWLNTQTAAQDVENTTVTELASLRTPHPLENKRFLLTVKIKEIAPGQSWWYLACNKCSKGTREYGNALKCSDYECPCTEGTARYRLALRVVEPNACLQDNGAPTIQIVFFGAIAQEILGVGVHELLNAGAALGADLPKQIEELYGKVITIKGGVGRYSFRNEDLSLLVNNIISVSPKGLHDEISTSRPDVGTSNLPTEKSNLEEATRGTAEASNVLPSEDALPPELNSEGHIQQEPVAEPCLPSPTDVVLHAKDMSEKDKLQAQTEDAEVCVTANLQENSTPMVGTKRQRSSKDGTDLLKQKRGESTARRKLILEESSEKNKGGEPS